MLVPLLDAEAAEADRIVLHSLMARIQLLYHNRPQAARDLLQALPIAVPGQRLQAERKLWLGWTHLWPEAEDRDPTRALHLLHEAEETFCDTFDPNGRLWALIGRAEAYLALEEPAPATSLVKEAERLQRTLQDAPARARLQALGEALPSAPGESTPKGPPDFIGNSPAMRPVIKALRSLSQSRLPLLLTGERGTGKQHLARTIHALGPRADGPFVALDCTDSPSEFVTRRLFDGTSEAPPALEEANGGILFLREVGALSSTGQKRLLHFLSERELPFRLIASTRRALAEDASFQKALYRRLQATKLPLSPLRERRADIPLLTRHFLDDLRPSGAPRPAITDRALEALVYYDWPGNVRQLRNEIERALVFVGSEPAPVVDLSSLSPALSSDGKLQEVPSDGAARKQIFRPDCTLEDLLDQTEKALIERVLKAQEGQVSASAEILGLSRQGLYKKMKRLGIDAARFHTADAAEQSPTPASP